MVVVVIRAPTINMNSQQHLKMIGIQNSNQIVVAVAIRMFRRLIVQFMVTPLVIRLMVALITFKPHKTMLYMVKIFSTFRRIWLRCLMKRLQQLLRLSRIHHLLVAVVVVAGVMLPTAMVCIPRQHRKCQNPLRRQE